MKKCNFLFNMILVFCLLTFFSITLFAGEIETDELVVNTDVLQQEQKIVGWGTSVGGDHLSESWREAYRDLGMNLLRFHMRHEVLVHAPDDFATPVELTEDMETNLELMGADTPIDVDNPASTGFQRIDPYGDTADWLAENALEPERVKVAGSLWTPPHWMKGPTGEKQNFVGVTDDYETPFLSDMKVDWLDEPQPTGDTVGGRLKTEDKHILEQYGWYIASWISAWDERYDKSFDVVSLQNESTFENPFISMTFIVDEKGNEDFGQYAIGLKSVKRAWEKFDMDTRIKGPHVAGFKRNPNNPYQLFWQDMMIEGVKNYEEDPELNDFLDYYNANFYNSTDEGNTKNVAGFWKGGKKVAPDEWGWHTPPGVQEDGKPIWYSETGEAAGGGWPNSIETALKIHSALVHGQASSYIYWQFCDGDDELTQHVLVTEDILEEPLQSKKYAAFKQYSRFIRPGARRINVGFGEEKLSSAGGNSVYDIENSISVSGFIHEQDEELSYVFVNKMNSDKNMKINLGNVPELFYETDFNLFRTAAGESVNKIDQLFPDEGVLSFVVPAESVVTLTTISL